MVHNKQRDWKERENILSSSNNIVVLASAGSGKTTMLVDKLQQELETEKQHYYYATITFTNKAANEISERVGNSKGNIFCGTIDGFVDNEIVRNYFHAVYPNYSGFEISYQSQHQFETFNDGLNQMKNYNILGTYKPSVQKLGKNFKLELALTILKNSQAAREYLKYKYRMFFIDEYQDSDKSMHDLFMYLNKELEIRLFVVGDIKQSIYQWRGASPKFLEGLSKSNQFEMYKLTENFRSHTDIVEFSRCVSGEPLKEGYSSDGRINYYHNKESNSEADVINNLVAADIINKSQSLLILVGKNEDIKNIYEDLGAEESNFTIILRTPIEGTPNSLFLESICRYYYDGNYTEYNFVNDIYYDYDRQIVKDVKKILDNLCKNLNLEKIEEIYSFCGFPICSYNSALESELLLKTLKNEKYKSAFVQVKEKRNAIMTTHSAKGLEYDQVIIFTKYYFDRYTNKIDKESHYVGITRAKEKLILIDDSGEYKKQINSIVQENDRRYTFEQFIACVEG